MDGYMHDSNMVKQMRELLCIMYVLHNTLQHNPVFLFISTKLILYIYFRRYSQNRRPKMILI